MDEHERFIGAFGKREMELAAIRIVDADLLGVVFDRGAVRLNGDAFAEQGFDLLCMLGWLVPAGDVGSWRVTTKFTLKCREAMKADDRKDPCAPSQ